MDYAPAPQGHHLPLPAPGRGGTILLGVDFPIGLPSAYAAKASIDDFRTALTQFGCGRCRQFYNPAELFVNFRLRNGEMGPRPNALVHSVSSYFARG